MARSAPRTGPGRLSAPARERGGGQPQAQQTSGDQADQRPGLVPRLQREVYLPWPPEFPATDSDPMGDGLAETLMLRDFANAVRRQTAPDHGVHFGIELSVTGIQAMRSSLAGSVPVEGPDLRRPDVRRAYAADE